MQIHLKLNNKQTGQILAYMRVGPLRSTQTVQHNVLKRNEEAGGQHLLTVNSESEISVDDDENTVI